MASNNEKLPEPSREAIALGALFECLKGGTVDRYDTGEVYLEEANKCTERATYHISRMQSGGEDWVHFHVIPKDSPFAGYRHYVYYTHGEDLRLVEAPKPSEEDVWLSFETHLEDARKGVLADALGNPIHTGQGQ